MTKSQSRELLLPPTSSKTKTRQDQDPDDSDGTDNVALDIESKAKKSDAETKAPKGFEGHCALKEASCCRKLFFTWNLPIWNVRS